jgi:hypothetical protein
MSRTAARVTVRVVEDHAVGHAAAAVGPPREPRVPRSIAATMSAAIARLAYGP